jgi:hypothetical protein
MNNSWLLGLNTMLLLVILIRKNEQIFMLGDIIKAIV